MERIIFFLVVIALISCKPKSGSEEITNKQAADTAVVTVANIPGLKRVWDTEGMLKTSESVFYDKANDVLYVSCIGSVPPDKKDGDGYIARVGLDGKVIEQKWAKGLSGPKGMGMVGNTLYVTDIDRLVAIDATTGKTSTSWPAPGAKFLNDLCTTDDGKVYFSDSNTNTIYSLKDEKVDVVLADTSLGGTNGILVEGNTMYITTYAKGNFLMLDLPTKKVSVFAQGVEGGDGVERYGDGWIASNWNGVVYHISSTGEVTEILNTQEAKLNAADIEVIADKNLLLVPTFFGNGVTAYELSKNN